MTRDPFTILQLANPVTPEDLTEPLTATALRDLYRQIVQAPPAPSPVPTRHLPRPGRVGRPHAGRPQRSGHAGQSQRSGHAGRARRRWLLAALAVVLTTSAAWAVYQSTREPTRVSSIACYAQADLGSSVDVVVNDGRPPLQACADLWARGAFGAVPVPPLVACVIPSGTVGVFPSVGPDTCRTVGGSQLDGGPTTSAPAGSPTTLDPLTLTDALREALGPQRCVDEGQAREVAQQELAARGLSTWSVVTQAPFTPDRPCATVAVDEPAQTVRLIPAPPRR